MGRGADRMLAALTYPSQQVEVAASPNQALQPTVLPPLRSGKPAA